ncbi:DNA-directed RNA polymerase subunit alpha [uncultured bacterium]|nr:DNA-directed RNA polymerase subunit alpha [uncultured bacterium]
MIIQKRITYEYTIKSYRDEIYYTLKLKNVPLTMGNTIGNTIRRVLITSIKGTSVKGFTISNLRHSFDYNTSLDKDADQISENIRDIIFAYNENVDEVIETDLQGPTEVKVSDIVGNLKVINGDVVLFKIVNNDKISIKLYMHNGIGFMPYYQHNLDDNIIPVTSIFTHIKDVSFDVIPNNVDERYEHIIIKFTTYDIYNDEKQVIYEAIEYIINTFNNIKLSLDNPIEDEENQEENEDKITRITEEILNEAKSELVKYIYDSEIPLKNTSEIIDLLKNIPDKLVINNVKIKKKEIVSIIKQLNKLLKK